MKVKVLHMLETRILLKKINTLVLKRNQFPILNGLIKLNPISRIWHSQIIKFHWLQGTLEIILDDRKPIFQQIG